MEKKKARAVIEVTDGVVTFEWFEEEEDFWAIWADGEDCNFYYCVEVEYEV